MTPIHCTVVAGSRFKSGYVVIERDLRLILDDKSSKKKKNVNETLAS